MSVRLRLTLSYVAFLVVAGVVLLAILYWLLHFIPSTGITDDGPYVPDRGDLLRVFWPRALIALGMLTAVGLVGGWLIAGRMLRPLDRITGVAREVANGRFDRRVRLHRRDEYGLLAGAFDAMLDRIEVTLDEQGRFAANASHELRTPLAVSRTMIDVALADPDGRDVDELLRRLRQTTDRGTDIVESLLTLAAVDRGTDTLRDTTDLAVLAADVVDALHGESDATGLAVTTTLEPTSVIGDPTLLRQLVFNLVLNAIRHNAGSGGEVGIATTTGSDGVAELHVTNSGPIIDPTVARTLTEPFVRADGRVAVGRRGSGLGLAIVARIADAHGASLSLAPRVHGGLDVRVRFMRSGA